MVDHRLAKRVEGMIGNDEKVVFVTRRDIIAILPQFVHAIIITIVLALYIYSFSNLAQGIVSRALFIPVAVTWIKFFAIDFANYEYELLALTKAGGSEPRAHYRKGMWLKKATPLKLGSLVSTVVNQSRAFYQSAINVGDIKLDAFGDSSDIYFVDCPDPYGMIKLVNKLVSEK